MKKFFALALVLVSLFSCAAMAEAVELVPVTFEDGFQISLPGDWLELELDEETMAQGIFYAACSTDGANTVQISWSGLDAAMTIEEVQADLATAYPDAQIAELNGIAFVGFTDTANDLFGFVALDAAEPGLYTFWFTPASDADFLTTTSYIVASICNVEI